jgi:hypothetical protein
MAARAPKCQRAARSAKLFRVNVLFLRSTQAVMLIRICLATELKTMLSELFFQSERLGRGGGGGWFPIREQ